MPQERAITQKVGYDSDAYNFYTPLFQFAGGDGRDYCSGMKNMTCTFLFSLIVFIASVVYGANVLTVDITVREKAGGKIVKQLKTDSDGNFAMGALPAGAYTLEFRPRKSAGLKNQQFSIAIDGIKKSGKQGGISGDSSVGGVALNVEVASGTKVTGQFTTGVNVAVKNSKKKMVWIPRQLGTNVPGHWAEEDSTEVIPAHNVGLIRNEDVVKWQDHGDVSAAKLLGPPDRK